MKKAFTNEELALFSDQLSMILHSGISVLEGISILFEDSTDDEEKKILGAVCTTLEETGDLAEALRTPGVYPEYFIHMAEIGDRSGTLEEVMRSLSSHYDREDAISRSIRDALTYPLVMIGMLAAVLVVLVVHVMPVFHQVFEQLGIEMSGTAETLLTLGRGLQRYSVVFLALFLLLVLAGFAAMYLPGGRFVIFSFINKIPLFRNISTLLACSRFSGALALSFHSGLDIEEGFRLASGLIDNRSFHEKTVQAQKKIEEGEDFSKALKDAGIYSGLNARMISIGFRTGSSEEAFNKIAVSCQEEADIRIQNMVSSLEPAIVAVLSVLTGMILLSVMLPLLGIMSEIG